MDALFRRLVLEAGPVHAALAPPNGANGPAPAGRPGGTPWPPRRTARQPSHDAATSIPYLVGLRHPPFQLRRRLAVRPRADLAAVPAHPGREGAQEAEEAEAVEDDFTPSLASPYRWRDWADPGRAEAEVQETASAASWLREQKLLPYLKGLKERPNATPRQKVTRNHVRRGAHAIDTERNFLDVLDKVHEIRAGSVDPTHVFPLSQVYEGLLLKMGEKGNDGGQFFTPRDHPGDGPQIAARTGNDGVRPGCGTGGF